MKFEDLTPERFDQTIAQSRPGRAYRRNGHKQDGPAFVNRTPGRIWEVLTVQTVSN